MDEFSDEFDKFGDEFDEFGDEFDEFGDEFDEFDDEVNELAMWIVGRRILGVGGFVDCTVGRVDCMAAGRHSVSV